MSRTIIEFNKQLKIGTTNVEYEKIFNCRVIDPTYEKGKGLYNSEFFLDKRFGMKEFVIDNFHYTDDIKIYSKTYFLYRNNSSIFVGVKTPTGIKSIAGPFAYDRRNPIRFSEGRGANGIRKEFNVSVSNGATIDNTNLVINEDGVYEDGYITLDVGTGLNIEAGDYVLFKSGIYAGATIRVDLYQDGKIYIIGINSRGSIPIDGDNIDIYSESGKVPLIGTREGLLAIHINGDNSCDHTNILTGNIDDVVRFNGEIFVLKGDVVYFSRSTFDDNLQFYKSADRKRVRGAYKLIPKGGYLLVMGDDNRLVSPQNDEYSFFPLNYSSELYSKYSYIFTDSTLYIIQSDREIAKIDITSNDSVSFNLTVTPITDTVKGLLDDIDNFNSFDKGEIYVNRNKNDRRIHFLYVRQSGDTLEYEYDMEYQHWLLNTYTRTIYKISEQYLCNGSVSDISGYTDLGEEYKQSINFTIQIPNLITKVGLLRMIMGVSNEFNLEYDVDIDVESSHSLTKRKLKIKSVALDTMPVDHSLDMLNVLMNGKDNKHDGNIASVQRTIMMSGRYHRYNINSKNRFIYGYSYVLGVPSNIFVNERNFSF